MHTCAYTQAHHLLNFVDIDKFDGVLQVLREPKNALGKQYQKLFSMNNVSILLSQHSHLEVQQLLNLDQCSAGQVAFYRECTEADCKKGNG